MFRASPRARISVITASILICLGLAGAPAFASSAAAGSTRSASVPAARQLTVAAARRGKTVSAALQKHDAEVRKVLREARRQRGKPYVYGEAGPHGFDCSGLVRYVFMHAVHRVLPHNASAQYHSLRHIRRSSLRPGDLVFVDNGGYVSHVGIYDGHGYWWVAPHTGTHVQRQKIYRAHLVYARVLIVDKHPAKK
jgi:peptidoglycan DL-endopeptidase CwlO